MQIYMAMNWIKLQTQMSSKEIYFDIGTKTTEKPYYIATDHIKNEKKFIWKMTKEEVADDSRFYFYLLRSKGQN